MQTIKLIVIWWVFMAASVWLGSKSAQYYWSHWAELTSALPASFFSWKAIAYLYLGGIGLAFPLGLGGIFPVELNLLSFIVVIGFRVKLWQNNQEIFDLEAQILLQEEENKRLHLEIEELDYDPDDLDSGD